MLSFGKEFSGLRRARLPQQVQGRKIPGCRIYRRTAGLALPEARPASRLAGAITPFPLSFARLL
jgi:hypothetical protein